MVKAFRSLTILMGKLRIGGDRFVINHDAIARHMGFKMPMPRPPWREGIEYGLSVGQSYAWVTKFLGRVNEKGQN